MTVNTRRFQLYERPSIVRCMKELQDYLIAVGKMARTRRMPEYGERFTERLLEQTSKNNGPMYVAECQNPI